MENVVENTKIQETPTKKRIEWIDVAKFFGIFLVFVAHGLWVNEATLYLELPRGIIYTFHMPLFFILSMMTTSLSDSKATFAKKTKKRAMHLLIPYCLIFICYLIIDITYLKVDASTKSFWVDNLLRLIGREYYDVKYMGPVWFFMALFVGQTLFDFLHLTLKDDLYLLMASMIISTIGVLMGISNLKFPFTLDMACSSIIFFFVGYKLKNFDFEKHQFVKFIILLVVWLGTMFLTFPDFKVATYYELWFRRFPLYPICIICAICGSMVFMYLIKWFCKIKYIYKPFAFLGRWTIVLVCVHAIDQFYFDSWFNFFPDNHFLTDYLGALIGIGISLVIIGFIYLYKLVIKPKLVKKEK